MTTMAEPEWDQHNRALALAHDRVDLCDVCRRPAYICQDPDRQDDWEVGAPIRCHATTALLENEAKFTEETNPHMRALMFPMGLRDTRGVTGG